MLNNLIYSYNDMSHFVLAPHARIDWGTGLFYIFFTKYISNILLNNIFLFVVFILSFLFSLLVFNGFGIRKIFAIILSFLYALSIYFIYRVISFTPGLYLIFIFPMIVYMLFTDKNPLILGVYVLFSLFFSNYYGFFSFLLVPLWYLFSVIFGKITFKEFLKKMIFFVLPIFIGVLIFFGTALINNLPVFGRYQKPTYQEGQQRSLKIYRPIEDWYNLSFRPWYFFIPPKSSIFFGEFSKNIHKKIQNTGHYLADDYMEEEMAGSYMGWHFLIGLGVVVTLLLIRKFKGKEFTTFKSVYENREIIYRSFFIIFCILLISGPPSFTIKGIKIYTPTYLLYYIVPVFRTLVRWAVVIYLFVLIINSFLVQDLYNLMKNKFQKILFIISFLSLNFVIFAIKIPVININKPPQEIAFVKEKYPESVPYAVYPKGDYYSIFWAISHKDLLINPVNVVNYETGFDSNEFSKNLVTQEGVEEFLKHTPKYLIYYPENISDKDLEKINKINSDLETREDIRNFFEKEIGTITYVGNILIFEVRQ